MSSSQAAAAFIERRKRNLAFFASHYPGIYQYFKDYSLQHSQLDIRPEANEADLIIGGKHLYGGQGLKYGVQEAQVFDQSFPEGYWQKSLAPIFDGEYTNPRFFAQTMRELYHLSPLAKAGFKGYQVPDWLPMVVCLGVGLGVHVEALLARRTIQHLMVVEHDMDRFAASLYTVDWQAIVERQQRQNGHSFEFVLIHNAENWYQVRATLWNHLINHVPFFPVTTYFYNHLGIPEYNQVIDEVNRDIYVHMYSFGNYDDELNQLNNALHNFRTGNAILSKASEAGIDRIGRSGVCVVGSGPSLDERLDDLRELSAKTLIVSCGTAIGPLLKAGIEPDIHIELESDYLTFKVQAGNHDREAMKKVRLIAAAQANPCLLELFGDTRLFFKAESPLSQLFGDSDEAIADTAPTCTNAALAIAHHYGFRNVYLFGLDYGFPSADKHHARDSLYFDESSEARVSDSLDQQTIEVDAADGGKILSTTFLYTSKRRTENVIVSLCQSASVFNCSNGAAIEKAPWIPTGEVGPYLDTLDDCREAALAALFKDDSRRIPHDKIEREVRKIQLAMQSLSNDLTALLSSPVRDLATFSRVCFRINRYLLEKVLKQNASYYYFIRGSLWHFLHAGYSHAFALEDRALQKAWIAWWQDRLRYFLTELPGHMKRVLAKDSEMADQLLRRSIREKDHDGPLRQVTYPRLGWKDGSARYSEEHGFIRVHDKVGGAVQ